MADDCATRSTPINDDYSSSSGLVRTFAENLNWPVREFAERDVRPPGRQPELRAAPPDGLPPDRRDVRTAGRRIGQVPGRRLRRRDG